MRLCDNDIIKLMNKNKLIFNPKPPIERINGVTVDVCLGNKFRIFLGYKSSFVDLSNTEDKINELLNTIMSDEINIDKNNFFFFTTK